MKEKLVNWFYFWTGMIFLLLAKIKNKMTGYTPKTFSTAEIERCVEYDIDIVNKWIKHLKEYAPEYTIQDKHVLELGPGSDLGVGLFLLSKSVKKYTSLDVYDLISNLPANFYDVFFTYLQEKYLVDIKPLAEELHKTNMNNNDKLNYVCSPDFNIIDAVGNDRIDVIFSNAAFEHFTDFQKVINDLSKVVQTGAVLVVEIDLKTHSRWIRDKDPNNIYRYPHWIYKLFNFCGIPNRVRPYQYQQALEQNGWENIVIQPITCLDNKRLLCFQSHLNKNFRDKINQMDYLTVLMSATYNK